MDGQRGRGRGAQILGHGPRGRGSPGGAGGRGGRGGPGGGRGRGAGHPNIDRPRKIFPTSQTRLEELQSKDDRQLVLTLMDPNFGFDELLSSSHMSYDNVAIVVALLAKAVTCSQCPKNLLALQNDVLCSDLLSVHVPRYLTTAPHDRIEAKQGRVRDVVENLAYLFDDLLQRFPNKASEVLGIAMLTVRDVVSRYETTANPLNKSLVDKIEQLEKVRSDILSKYESDMRDKMSSAESAHARLPPSDFRSMSIFPTQADIHETLHPFLRANLVRGNYNDVDHYLDVHFRLMREDFVGPLRDGLSKYLALVGRGKRNEAQHQKDIKVYFDVRIVTMEVAPHEGLLHMISFDVSKLRKVRWEASKRLMYGSLVCISADNFQTLQLGVVVKRDVKMLADGYVFINLVGGEGNARIAPNVVHTLVESPAYFEAYSPILRGLQTMTDDSIPFKQYIIDAAANLEAPRYLLKHSVYDFGPLTKTPTDQRLCRVLATHDGNGGGVGSWPSADDLQLDAAQYSALKTCLTKEVAVIQGPPGTGKTFLGLKVVEVLLLNRDVWASPRRLEALDVLSPLLIVCFTNHALDQFLEGILRFAPRNLVRIGGQSKTKTLEPYNLSFLRRIATQERGLAAYVYSNRKLLLRELYTIGDEISDQMNVVKNSEHCILHEDVLRTSMRDNHFEQLKYVEDHWYCDQKPSKSSAILIWLNINAVNFGVEDTGEEQPENFGPVTVEEDGVLEVEDFLAEDEMDRRIQDNFDDDDLGDFLGRRNRRHVGYRRDRSEARFADFTSITDADGFQTAGGAKRIKKMVQREMKKTSTMTDAEEKRVRNVHQLSLNDRWRLYRHWVAKLKQSRMNVVNHLYIEYERTHLRLKEVLRELDVGILRNASVIGVTTTGAAKNRELLQIIKPKIVVIEEAAEVLEAHVITALSGHCEHLILIGDQQQLRPNPTVYRLAHEYNLDVSLFERLIGNGLPYERLLLQHRMRPRISKLLVPHIYKDLHDHESVKEYPHVRGFVNDVYFVSHEHTETSVSDTSSRVNGFEANFLLAICRHLLLQGYKPEQITMLATYLGQAFLIKQLKANTIAKDVKCTVVDNFQGEENDIILLSLVRSNDDGKVGFLKVDNRVCVALSRAKIGLICIGNFDFLSDNARIWKGIVDSMKIDGLVGPTLKLRCDNHPNVITEVATTKDFSKAPEGGCNLPCEFRLPCGHQCPKMCHVYDAEHKEMGCIKPCEKILCELGHKCKKLCKDDCGKCRVSVAKVSPQCGHVNQIPCHKSADEVFCNQPCEKLLTCGHICEKICREPCTASDCNFKVSAAALCGHMVKAPCNAAGKELKLMTFCKEPCTEILPCEHRCTGNCHDCRQGRMHVRCRAKCGRTLVCGHLCKFPCARACPPCQEKCENRCAHSRCPIQCGVPCTPCQEFCTWRCDHLRCTKHCYEPCDRPPCNEPCPALLNCGHPCIGFCGEPCPKKCRICDRDEVCEIFFGTEDEEDARFVLLTDCNHIVESTGMDYFLGETRAATDGEHKAIEMKRCPKCKTIIRTTLRYMTTINQTLNDVMAIKRKYFGESRQLVKMRNTLQGQFRELAAQMLAPVAEFVWYNQIANSLGNKRDYYSLTDVHNLTNVVNLRSAMIKENAAIKPYMIRFDSIFVKTRLKELEEWFRRLDKQSSDKEFYDFTREFQRICNLSALVRGADSSTLNPKAREYYDKACVHLMDLHPFTEFLEKETNDLIAEMKKHHSGLGISEAERVEILNAFQDLRKGHWFKCRNGHLYAIGQCGGAMEVSTCPECHAPIGGSHHRLQSDNQLATEMDGATTPAYPTALMGRRLF